MCGLGSALFSEPHQNVHIGRLADLLARIKPGDVTTAIFSEEAETTGVSMEDILRIAGFYQQTALHGNPLTKTFAVLASFYLCPEVKATVCATTSVKIATAYFDGFMARFQEYLCGTVQKTALLPMEIVLREWQLYTKLITR